MIVRATAAPTYLNPPPLLRPRPGLAPLTTQTAQTPQTMHAAAAAATADASDFSDADWAELDDEAASIDVEADAADAALLRCVGCAAFATLVLALVSSLQMA